MDPIGIMRAAQARREAIAAYEAFRQTCEEMADFYRAEGMNRQVYEWIGRAVRCRRARDAERNDLPPAGLHA